MRKHTEETKLKIKNSAKKRAVVKLSITGRFIAIYESVSEAARQNNLKRYSITRCCKSDFSFTKAGGFRWKYIDDINLDKLIKESK